MEHYGTDSYSKTEEFRNRFIETCIKKYGVDNPSKNREIHKKQMFGKYHAQNGRVYDSKWEYKYEQYLIENRISYKYQSKETFDWVDIDGVKHKYIPDFCIIRGESKEYIEIKGDHFFDKDGNFIDPYNKSDDAQKNAKLKYECMMRNNIKILTSKELKSLGIKLR